MVSMEWDTVLPTESKKGSIGSDWKWFLELDENSVTVLSVLRLKYPRGFFVR